MARGWALTEKARRLLARESGALVKNWGGRLPFALIYPSPYYVGMSSLGLQAVYGLLNGFDGVVCERVFLNLGKDTASVEPLSIESQRHLQDFAVLGFSLSFELDYVNVIRVLRDAAIPLLRNERDGQPLVIAGGPAVSANPAPLAPYVDAFVIGELEAVAADFVPALADVVSGDAAVADLARLPGLYVPEAGGGKQVVRRVWAGALDEWRTATIVSTPYTEFGDMHLVEMARGCTHGCRFCLAGHVYRPLRQRSADLVLAMAREGAAAGRTVGLVAPSLSDIHGFRGVLHSLAGEGVRVSVSSLRADSLDDDLMADLVATGNRAIAIAPEAGSDRLRSLIGKGLDEEAVVEAAGLAEKHGLPELKLYFIVGLPTESENDVRAAASLVKQVRSVFTRRLVANVSCFVPKPSTPFQWQGFMPVATLRRRLALFATELRGTGVTVRAESPEWSLLQAVLSRGDERVGLALSQVGRYSRESIAGALAHGGIDLEVEAGPRVLGGPLPWDGIDGGLPDGYLERRGAIGGE